MDRRSFLAGAAAATAVAAGLPARATVAAPAIGSAAPEFQGVTAEGRTVSLSQLRGKVVVLEWTNHDCPFVRKHYNSDNMQALQREAKERGVVWLTVVSSPPGEQGHVTPAQALDLSRSRKAEPAHVVLDPKGTIGRSYGAQVTPHMYVIDAGGVLRYMGAIDDKPSANPETVKTASNYVRPAIAALLEGKPVATPVTRAYGCSIKLAPQTT
ncbi:thioredoxin family protein [Stella sp.]|uniref:thioredoxin family protein n=1 Tax=Stella sp. TaxID=2912054 RepID=UPI0035AF7C1A